MTSVPEGVSQYGTNVPEPAESFFTAGQLYEHGLNSRATPSEQMRKLQDHFLTAAASGATETVVYGLSSETLRKLQALNFRVRRGVCACANHMHTCTHCGKGSHCGHRETVYFNVNWGRPHKIRKRAA